jgi:hypothetical protein
MEPILRLAFYSCEERSPLSQAVQSGDSRTALMRERVVPSLAMENMMADPRTDQDSA